MFNIVWRAEQAQLLLQMATDLAGHVAFAAGNAECLRLCQFYARGSLFSITVWMVVDCKICNIMRVVH